jgi:uncharacterized protein (TIGR03067 family)
MDPGRMPMNCIACLTLATLVVAAGRPAVEPKKDLDRFQGNWNVLAVEVEGKRLSAEQTMSWKVRFEGDKYSLQSGKEKIEGTFRLNPTQSPKAIDATRASGADKGKTLRGIYRLSGDRLLMCLGAAGGKKRPTSFITQSRSGFRLYVLERAK